MAGLTQKERGHGNYYKAGFCIVRKLSWKERSEEMAAAELFSWCGYAE